MRRSRSLWSSPALLALIGLLPAVAAAAPAFTPDQRDHGERVYARHCAACHGGTLQGGLAPALTGAEFAARWGSAGRTAADLFYVVSTSMPRPANGSLPEKDYVDVVAYLLAANGGSAGSVPLRADSALPVVAGAAAGRRTFIAGERGLLPQAGGPSAAELRTALSSTGWPYHNHDLNGTRYSPLADIRADNVARLGVTCLYQVGTLENFVTGPVVHGATMYLTTPQLTIAIDARTCRERWRYRWAAQDQEQWPNNRGVAIGNGYVVRGTNDGYLLALDAGDGHLLWARQVALPAAGEVFTMPPLIVDDLIIIGPAGSENAIQGWVGAFRLADGAPVWRFNTVPRAGEPGFETWQHAANTPVGGGAVWSPLSVDLDRSEVYVPVTNPAPVLNAGQRPGANLYTDSLVALDLRTGRLRWYVQTLPNDDKDWDVTQVSPLLDVTVAGTVRHAVVVGGKDGIVRLYDRDSHELLHQTALGTRLNTDRPVTAAGLHFCPGDLGGLQWNGPAWHPDFGLLFVPTVDWCTTARLGHGADADAGKDAMGGTDTMDDESHGYLTAIEAATGAIRWQYRSPKPMVAGVVATAGGLVFTGENTGDVVAFAADDGRVLYRFNAGGAMTAGVITYAVDGHQYVAVATGKGSFWFGEGRGAPTIVVFALPQ